MKPTWSIWFGARFSDAVALSGVIPVRYAVTMHGFSPESSESYHILGESGESRARRRTPINSNQLERVLRHMVASSGLAATGSCQSPILVPYKPLRCVERIGAKHCCPIASNDTQLFNTLNNRMWLQDWLLRTRLTTYFTQITQGTTGFLQLATLFSLPFVVKRAQSCAGSGCKLITVENDWREWQSKHENEQVCISPFLGNVSYNAHGVVLSATHIYVTIPSIQLVGIPHLTSNVLSYCGNIFPCNPGITADIEKRTRFLGQKLAGTGYRGVFGVDYVESKSGDLHIVDVNPRLQGSTMLLNALEQTATPATTLNAHLASFSEQSPHCRYGDFATGGDCLQETMLARRRSYVQIVMTNCASYDVSSENEVTAKLVMPDNTILAFPPMNSVIDNLDRGAIALFDCPRSGIPVQSGAMLCRAWFSLPSLASDVYKCIVTESLKVTERVRKLLKLERCFKDRRLGR